jgi:hypothetical protein
MWTEDDLRTTIPFEEIEVLASEDSEAPEDLLDELPSHTDRIGDLEPQSGPRELTPTTGSRKNWQVTPPLEESSESSTRTRQVHDEVTAVTRNPLQTRQSSEESYWVDVHAVVDEDGRLSLPPRLARRLEQGAVVELRIAQWALSDE